MARPWQRLRRFLRAGESPGAGRQTNALIPIKIEKQEAGRDKLRAARVVQRSEGENLTAEFLGTDAGS